MNSPANDTPSPLIDLLDGLGVSRSSLIRLTGPDALAGLIWFCRQGYEQVGYMRAGAGCPHEQPDAVIVAHACEAGELGRLMSAAREVRPGGAFIFQLQDASADTLARAERTLASNGFAITTQISVGARSLVAARRGAVSLHRAA